MLHLKKGDVGIDSILMNLAGLNRRVMDLTGSMIWKDFGKVWEIVNLRFFWYRSFGHNADDQNWIWGAPGERLGYLDIQPSGMVNNLLTRFDMEVGRLIQWAEFLAYREHAKRGLSEWGLIRDGL